ncbi:MAG: PAS domain S-box protein [Burkholderiales bacterium]|nr:PAS domain S-box protein [Burkholderiales bacterium]
MPPAVIRAMTAQTLRVAGAAPAPPNADRGENPRFAERWKLFEAVRWTLFSGTDPIVPGIGADLCRLLAEALRSMAAAWFALAAGLAAAALTWPASRSGSALFAALSLLCFAMLASSNASRRRAVAGAWAMTVAVRDSRERMRLIVEAAPHGMVMVDRSGCITLVNSRVEQLFEYARHELVGQPLEVLIPEYGRLLRHCCRGEGAAFGDLRAAAGPQLEGWRRDGSEFPMDVALTPIDAPDGRSILVSIIDITARRKADRDLRAACERQQLLLREIHHRVKNNMQVISGTLQLQARKLDTPAARAVFEESQSRIRIMALAHEQLYGQDDCGALDFGQYLAGLLPLLIDGSAPPNVRFEVRACAAAVSIDSALPLGQLVAELVQNALKHAFPGAREGLISIDFEPAGERLRLRVSDDGVGLPLDAPAPRAPRGIGLRMAGMLAKQIGGELTVERPGRGAAFCVTWEERDESDERQ